MEYHARNLVSVLVHNSSHNCNAVKVLITSAAWPQRKRFLDIVRQIMKGAQPRVAYYPGSDANYKKYMEAYPDAEVLGACPQDAPGVLVPWTLQTDISATDIERGVNDTCCSFEPWCGVLSEVVVPADKAGQSESAEGEVEAAEIASFLRRAVVLANERCFGSLSVAVLVSPEEMEKLPDELDRAIASLRYGSIAVNGPSNVTFAIQRLPWGAFPGNSPKDIGSGNGFVHNTTLLDEPQKGVLWFPWRECKKPFWDMTQASTDMWRPAVRVLAYKQPLSADLLKMVSGVLIN